MRLIQLSDCHLFSDKTYTGYASVNPYVSLNDVLKLTASLNPDIVIVTGDISGDDSEQSYQHFLTLLQVTLPDVKCAVLPGNHDNNTPFQQLVCKHSLFSTLPINLEKWMLHGLDTRYQGTLGKIDDDSLKHLESTVISNPERHHIIALHHHPIAAHSWMDTHSLLNKDALISFVEKTEQVKLLLHGHVHFPLERYIRDTPVLGVPSTCWQWQMTQHFAFSYESPGLRIIDFYDNGSWSTQIRRV